MNVSSTDTDDTVLGTGAWNLTLSGLDADYVPQSETIQLNGQTPDQTVNAYLRVNRAYIRKVGGDYVIYSDGNIEPIDGFRLGRLGTSSVEIYKEVIIINKAYIEKLFERRRR